MSKPLSQRSHSNSKDSKCWQVGSMPYGKASKSARLYREGERILGEAENEAGLAARDIEKNGEQPWQA